MDAPTPRDGVVRVYLTCGPTQPGDIPGTVRYKTYEVLKEETANPLTFWAYLPYSMHMAGPRGHPPHDDPQELRLHALHHRPRHGWLQVVHRRGGLYGAYDAQDFARENVPRWHAPCPR